MLGRQINECYLDLEIYRLLLPFLSSEKLYTLSVSNQQKEFLFLQERFELSESAKSLLFVAISIRNIIESSNSCILKKFLGHSVGILRIFKEEGFKLILVGKMELTFIEACHKIIHAIDFDFYSKCKEKDKLILGESIKLFGKKNEKNWEAELNILKFAQIAYKITIS